MARSVNTVPPGGYGVALGVLILAGTLCVAMAVGNIVLRRARRSYPALAGINVPLVTASVAPATLWLGARAFSTLVYPLWGEAVLCSLAGNDAAHERTLAIAGVVVDIALGVWVRWLAGFGLWFSMQLWRLHYLVRAFTPSRTRDAAPEIVIAAGQRTQWVLFGTLNAGMAAACTLASAVRAYAASGAFDDGATALLFAGTEDGGATVLDLLPLCVLAGYTLFLVALGALLLLRLSRALLPGEQFGDHRTLLRTHAAVSVLLALGQAADFAAALTATPGQWQWWWYVRPAGLVADAGAVAASYFGTLARPVAAALHRDAEYERSFFRYFAVFSPSPANFDAAMRDPVTYDDFLKFLEGGEARTVQVPVRLVAGRTAVYTHRTGGDAGIGSGGGGSSVLMRESAATTASDAGAAAAAAPASAREGLAARLGGLRRRRQRRRKRGDAATETTSAERRPRTFLVEDRLPPAEIVLEVRPQALAHALRVHRRYTTSVQSMRLDGATLAMCRRLVAFAHGMAVPPPTPRERRQSSGGGGGLPRATPLDGSASAAGSDTERLESVFVPVLDGPLRRTLDGNRALPVDAFDDMHAQLLAVARQLYYGQFCMRGRVMLWNEVRARRAQWTQLGLGDEDHAYARDNNLFGEAGTLLGGDVTLEELGGGSGGGDDYTTAADGGVAPAARAIGAADAITPPLPDGDMTTAFTSVTLDGAVPQLATERTRSPYYEPGDGGGAAQA